MARWNFDPESRARRRRMSFRSERGKVVVGIPDAIFREINRARGEFPRPRGSAMSFRDAVTYVLQSCPEV